jgi:hypothetical protein
MAILVTCLVLLPQINYKQYPSITAASKRCEHNVQLFGLKLHRRELVNPQADNLCQSYGEKFLENAKNT